MVQLVVVVSVPVPEHLHRTRRVGVDWSKVVVDKVLDRIVEVIKQIIVAKKFIYGNPTALRIG